MAISASVFSEVTTSHTNGTRNRADPDSRAKCSSVSFVSRSGSRASRGARARVSANVPPASSPAASQEPQAGREEDGGHGGHDRQREQARGPAAVRAACSARRPLAAQKARAA